MATAALVLAAAAVLVLPGGAAQAGFTSGPAAAAANSSWRTGSAPALSGPLVVGQFNVATRTVRVTWAAAAGTTSYRVADDHGYSATVGTTTRADVPAPVGVTDTITVTASNGFTASVQVEVVATDTTALTVSVPSITQVDTAWTPLNGATSYEVQLSTSQDFTTGIISRAVTGTSASFTAADGVQAGKTYWTRVRAAAPTPAAWGGPEQLVTPNGVYVNTQVNATNPNLDRSIAVDPARHYVWVSSSSTGTLSRFDTQTKTFTTFTTPGNPETVAVEPQSGTLAVQMGWSANVYMVPEDAATNPDGTPVGASLLTVPAGYGAASGISTDAVGHVYVGIYGAQDGWATIAKSGGSWTITNHLVPAYPTGEGFGAFRVSPDGTHVSINGLWNNCRLAAVIDTATLSMVSNPYDSGGSCHPRVVTPFTGPDGSARWIVRGAGTEAHVLDAVGHEIDSANLAGTLYAYDANTQALYVSSPSSPDLWRYDHGDIHATPTKITLPSGIFTVATADSTRLWAIGMDPASPASDYGNVRVVEIPRA